MGCRRVDSQSQAEHSQFTYHQNHKSTCPQLCFEWTPFDVVHCHYKYIRVFRGSTTNALPFHVTIFKTLFALS